MADSYIKVAHDYGMTLALKELGYASIEDVEKQALDLGLVESPEAEKNAALAGLFPNLKK